MLIQRMFDIIIVRYAQSALQGGRKCQPIFRKDSNRIMVTWSELAPLLERLYPVSQLKKDGRTMNGPACRLA